MPNHLDQIRLNSSAYFAKQLISVLQSKNIEISPTAVSRAFNNYSQFSTFRPHTVRKWLLGISKPRSETLLLLAEWLNVEPQDLLTDTQTPKELKSKASFEFDFTDQEVISKYLAMTNKEKAIVRLVIDAIAGKQK